MNFLPQIKKILILLLLLLGNRCQAQVCDSEVYPDFFIEEDFPLPQETKANRNVIYYTKFFAEEKSQEKYVYLKKYGLFYTPDTSCGPDVEKVTPSTKGELLFKDLFLKPGSTTIENKSELVELFQKAIRQKNNKGIECNFPIEDILATSALTYKIYVYVDKAAKLKVSINDPSSPPNPAVPINPKEVGEKDLQAGTNKITIIDEINTNDDFHLLTLENNPSVEIKFGKTYKIKFEIVGNVGEFYLSNYYITMKEDSDFTNKIGTNECSKDVECLDGYVCNGNEKKCVKCSPKCATCEDFDTEMCKKCGPLSEEVIEGRHCKVEYFDISQPETFTIENLPFPDTNRVTLGFWVFISKSLGQFEATVTVEKFLKISIKESTITCTIREDRPNPDDDVDITNSNKLIGRWFHTQCAMSYDNSEFYINVVTNNKDNYKKKGIRGELLYIKNGENVYEDNYFYQIYNENQIISVKGPPKKQEVKFYLRNMALFKEYMPIETHYMYHNVLNIIDLFPELIFGLPFIIDKENGNTFELKGKVRENGKIEEKIVTISSPNFDFTPPLNFKKLPLLDKNKCFERIDLTQEGNFPMEPDEILKFHKNKAMACTKYVFKDKCEDSCTKANNRYIINPGIEAEKGYCLRSCTNSMACKMSDGGQVLTGNNYCANNNYMNLYYNCASINDSYHPIHYSSYFGCANIIIEAKDIGNKLLKSYMIEFWYYNNGNNKADGNKIKIGGNYVFYSNAVKIHLDEVTDPNGDKISCFAESDKKLKKKNGKEGEGLDFIQSEWNKFTISVNYFKKTQGYIIQIVMNDDYKTPLSSEETSVNQDFRFIAFCAQGGGKCDDFKVDKDKIWGTGLYKDLKIWDGSLVGLQTTIQYSHFFSTYKESIKALLKHFPLTAPYFRGNIIKDIKDNINDDTGIDISNGSTWRLRLWNFSSKMDLASTFPSLGITLDKGSNDNVICGGNCLRCWNYDEKKCYMCKQGYFLNMERKCVEANTYYLRIPRENTDNRNIELSIFNGVISDKVTVTFWLKIFGFSSATNTIIESFSSTNTKVSLFYQEDQDKDNYGLNLGFGADDIIGNFENFKEYFGQWVHFSLAYYNKPSIAHFFPKMMKFEVNDKTVPIDYDKIKAKTFNIDKFVISGGVYSLIYSVKVYTDYVIGAAFFDFNLDVPPVGFRRPNLEKSFFTSGTNDRNCFDTSNFDSVETGDSFKCILDNDEKVIPNADFKDLDYYDFEKPGKDICSGCVNFCYGPNPKNSIPMKCTCLADNNNSQMIIDNNGANYCSKFKYWNFAKAEKIKIENVNTAKETKKYTMHFWFLAYSYVKYSFGGLKLVWNGHNKIEVSQKANNQGYTFSCIPAYDESNPTDDKKIEQDIEVNQWTFVSCAVDFSTKKIHTNVYDPPNRKFNDKSQSLGDLKETAILSGSSTYLSIEDTTTLDEWGLLFYKNIRLWSEAYSSGDFLSRIKIENFKLFPYLLVLIETTYDKDYIAIRVRGETEKLIQGTIKNKGKYGMNVVKEEIITKDDEEGGVNGEGTTTKPDSCSEQGQYYDYVTEKCLQFTDLSKMKDLKFENLPMSYSGSYSMAFWIFIEDTSTLTGGLNIQWTEHLQITMIQNSLFEAYCFPQGYYTDSIPNNPMSEKYSNAKNKAKTEFQDSDGTWVYVLCSVSNYNKKFILNTVEGEIETETLYQYNGKVYKSSYPLRFFNSKDNQKSSLIVENITNTKKVFIRILTLFRDFIPYEYDFRFVDLSKMKINEFKSLLFVCNFENFNVENRLITYQTYPDFGDKVEVKTLKACYYNTVACDYKDWTFELSGNFIFLSLCDPTKNMYYSETEKKCISNPDCITANLNARYCMGPALPLTCQDKFYISIDPTTKAISCDNKCPTNVIRSPGATESQATQGICNVKCQGDSDQSVQVCPFQGTSQLSDYTTTYQCANSFQQINYRCYKIGDTEDETKLESTALYYSRCQHPPNIFKEISAETTTSLSEGYLYEFWFKIDTVNCETLTTENEYYLYSRPHSIYRSYKDSLFYYDIIGVNNPGKLQGISQYEWNKIIIKTTLGTSQEVEVYLNSKFSSPEQTYTGIKPSQDMTLKSISFCTGEDYGKCEPSGKAAISWGSAFYRNIRVWALKTASVEIIQSYVNGAFSEELQSLILFYPLTIDKIDKNELTEVISKKDSIIATLNNNGVAYSSDKYLLYNYGTNFDFTGEGKYVTAMNGVDLSVADCHSSCKRCYSGSNSYCYECKDKYILIEQECVATDKYYLKTPATAENAKIFFKMQSADGKDNISSYPAFTVTFYMKFFGVSRKSTRTQPVILQLNSDTFLVYDITTTDLVLMNNGQVAFRDSNFNQYYGKWIPIAIANYKSAEKDVYPHMLTLSVNKIDIPFQSGYQIPDAGIQITELSLGYEVVGLFYDLRLYNKFIQGAFGRIKADSTQSSDGLLVNYALEAGNDKTCVSDGNLSSGTANDLGITCSRDYNVYADTDKNCGNNDKYFDSTSSGSSKVCNDCDSVCSTTCFGSSTESCTCELSKGYFWLRRNKVTKRTYCEKIPYIDFAVLKSVEEYTNSPSSKTQESTIEFWVFVYSYNNVNNNFDGFEIQWDKHNRVHVYNGSGTLNAKCYAIFDLANQNRYTENKESQLTFNKWTNIRCGSSLVTKKYFLSRDGEPNNGEIDEPNIPVRGDTSTIIIKNSSNSKPSFGFVFIRELKFWQQYNRQYIDTRYIEISSFKKYPGLLAYFKNTYKGDGNYELVNEIVEEGEDPKRLKTVMLSELDGYKGYNLVDPDNTGLYSELTLCSEGMVWNSATSACVSLPSTKCEYPGDLNDNCITCDASNIFIHDDGQCVSDCPTKYYSNPLINQCRSCHFSCNTCTGFEENQCESCEGLYFLIEEKHLCVTDCKKFGLIESKITSQKCVSFEAEVVLINPPPGTHINNNVFSEIEASIVRVLPPSATLSYSWGFDRDKTLKLNEEKYPDWVLTGTPFILDQSGNTPKTLKAPLNPGFFDADKIYVVYLDVSADGSKILTSRTYFELTMNEKPKNGNLVVYPEIGVNNLTNFVITCGNWVDDTTNDLEYQIQYYEEGTDQKKPITLSDWSSTYEIYKNFTLIYPQKPSSSVTIYCKVRDNYNEESIVEKTIKIASSLSSGIYNLNDAIGDYEMPKKVTPNMFLIRSEYLKSLGLDTFKPLRPDSLQSKYEPSLDQSIMTIVDPICTSDFCNNNGKCDLVDEFLACDCELGYLGSNCHIPKTGYAKLEEAYIDFYKRLFGELQNSIDDEQFFSLHNLFYSAQFFFQDPTFFSNYLDTYLTLAMNLFGDSIEKNTLKYIDLFDYYYSYELNRLNQERIKIKISSGYPYRNISITEDEMKEYQTSLNYIFEKMKTFLKYVVKLNIDKGKQTEINYELQNFYVAVVPVNPSFVEANFFKKRIENYKSHAQFMKCLNYIESEKLKVKYFTAWMIYIEYNNFPYSFNDTLSSNHTSPLIDLQFIDTSTGKEITVSDCTGDNAIVFNLPFTSYKWIDELNRQKWLFDPNEYKSPDDPIFKDPIYINGSGYISNDTIEERIELYNRLHNFSCEYYDTSKKNFVSTGLTYLNFTSDTNYIVFNSTHLSKFTTFFIENHMTFSVQNRFFYLGRPQIFKYWPNYSGNYGFYIVGVFIGLYILLCIILSAYDSHYLKQEVLLDFIKVEIIKIFLPYNKEKEREVKAQRIVPHDFIPGFVPANIFGKNSKKTLEKEEYLDKIDADEKEKGNFLGINKFTNTGEEDEEEDQQREETIPHEDGNEVIISKKLGGFFNDDPKKKEPKKGSKNAFVNEADIGDAVGKKKKGKYDFDPNHLPDEFEDEEEQRQKEIETFTNINLSFCEFVLENIKNRHLFLNPILNVSLLNPRWKKMTILLTQLSIFMIMISVQLTADENAKFDTNVASIIKIAVLSILASDVVMYAFPLFFTVTYMQRRRLHKLVVSGGQLIVLKEWQRTRRKNCLKNFIGYLICLGIWAFAFYISIGFVAVWNNQELEWLITFFICFLVEYVFLECLVELLVAAFYSQRRDHITLRKIGEFLNRVRNYRGMYP